MKRTFFSKLLMGAMAIATISFVSCKDYDDDISNLQAQIDKAALTDDITALQARLTEVATNANTALETAEKSLTAASEQAIAQAKAEALKEMKAYADQIGQDLAGKIQEANDAAAAAKAAADNAQNTADNAQTAANNAQTAADNAQTTADNALNTANGAQTAANNAQTTADAAKTAALAAQSAADQAIKDAADAAAEAAAAKAAAEGAATAAEVEALRQQLAQQLITIGDLQSQVASANALSEKVADLEKQIALIPGNDSEAVRKAIEEATARVDAYQAAVDALWSAVTSVSLYINTWNGYGHKLQGLRFYDAIEKENLFPKSKAVADSQFVFTEGRHVAQIDSVFVRVSPTNATLNTSMIRLVNSRGQLVDESLIEVIEVSPWDKLLTRATSESGLWKVVFKLADGYDEDLYQSTFRTEDERDILFAVAVNNTPEQQANRMVVSEYEIYAGTSAIGPAWNFTVNDIDVSRIHNRWTRTENMAYNNYTNVPTDPKRHVVELLWKNSTEENPTPAVAATEDNSDDRVYNSYFGTDDNRQDYNVLFLDADENGWNEITIKFDEAFHGYKAPIRGFYVTLDQEFAVESKPSENNAWCSYEYQNVGYDEYENGVKIGVKQQAHLFAGQEGTIKVRLAANVKYDIIGFRVYAVNLDGTLYDPDGRAFYVLIGNPADNDPLITTNTNVINMPANPEVKSDGYGNYYTTGIATAETNETDTLVIFNERATKWVWQWAENNPAYLYGTLREPVATTSTNISNLFDFTFYDAADQVVTGADIDNAVKIEVAIKDYSRLLDNETYHLTLIGVDESMSYVSDTVQKIAVNITKNMPTDVPTLTKKANQLANGRLTVLVKPINTVATGGNIWNVADANDVTYATDILPYDLADIFQPIIRITDPNDAAQDYAERFLSFEFEKTAYDTENEELVSYFSDILSSTLPWHKNFIPGTYGVTDAYKSVVVIEGQQKSEDIKKVYVNYNYKKASLTLDEDGLPVVADYPVRASKSLFDALFVSAFQINNFSLLSEAQFAAVNDLAYGTAAEKAAVKPLYTAYKNANDTVYYEDAAKEIDLGTRIYGHLNYQTLLNLSSARGIAQAELPGTPKTMLLSSMLANGYLKISEDVAPTVTPTDYFDIDPNWDWVANGSIRLISKHDTQRPAVLSGHVKHTIKFQVEDVFGHTANIEIPVTMRKPVVIESRRN